MTQNSDTNRTALSSENGTTDVSEPQRDERSVNTRNRVLEAAIEVLVAEGYSGASTLSIQQHAGFSRGRVLHHFPSRDDLLVAAAEYLARHRVEATVARSVMQLDERSTGTERLNHVIEFMWATYHEPHFWATIELWVAARTNDHIATELLPEERQLGRIIRNSVDLFFGRDFIGHPNYPVVRDTLLSSMRGVALTYAFDRRDFRNDPHISDWQTLAAVLLGEPAASAVAD